MDYITKNKVQISYMDFRGLCVRWAFWETLQQNQISDTHFRINSKSNSANTADIFMLPEDSESLEFKQLLSDFKISNSYAQPGEWYISYDFPSGNPSPVNRVTSLDKLPNKF